MRSPVSVEQKRSARLPPRWFVRTTWVVHRAIYSLTRGRIGLRTAKPDPWGMLRLTTTGRRTGQRRQVILAYIADGPNLVLIAMNGWADPSPAWWLNLQANPDATVDLSKGSREVSARVATAEERSRLWRKLDGASESLDAYAALRSRETPLVILEPRLAR
jgi:deazaflavin-dependent oxidoreductase (nitroreductase family)